MRQTPARASTPGAACFAITRAGSRRSRSTSWCPGCCGRFRRRPSRREQGWRSEARYAGDAPGSVRGRRPVVLGPDGGCARSRTAISRAPPTPRPHSRGRMPAPNRAPSGPHAHAERDRRQARSEDESGSTGAAPGEAIRSSSNGLGEPALSRGRSAGELSATAERDCPTSGFVAARAPTGDYGIDVHIDTGVLGLGLRRAVERGPGSVL